jgi:hypothetical protein
MNIAPEVTGVKYSTLVSGHIPLHPTIFLASKSFTLPGHNYRDAKLETPGRSFIHMTRRWNRATNRAKPASKNRGAKLD